MPVTRFNESEEESVRKLGQSKITKLNSLIANRAFADHIASEMNQRFDKIDISEKLGGKNAIHLSVSWG